MPGNENFVAYHQLMATFSAHTPVERPALHSPHYTEDNCKLTDMSIWRSKGFAYRLADLLPEQDDIKD